MAYSLHQKLASIWSLPNSHLSSAHSYRQNKAGLLIQQVLKGELARLGYPYKGGH